MEKNIKKFNEMEVGGTYSTYLLLQAVTEKTAKNGKTYVELELCDGNETVIARQFDSSKHDLVCFGIDEESVVFVSIKVDLYNGARNYTITNISGNYEDDITVCDFIVRAPIDFEATWDELIDTIRSCHKTSEEDIAFEPISVMTERILDNAKDVFMHWAAGKMIHHNVVGGLLQHTAFMVREAAATADVYPSLDRELLVCGAALHDIGKIREMTTSPTGHIEYTEEGRLIGHAAIGIMIIEDWAELSGCSPRRVKLLQHMIAAHHGQQEIGAVVEPAVPEAAVLHAIDMIDSRIYIFNEAYKNMEEGAMSGNIYALGNKTVFKPVPIVPTESQEEDEPDEDFDLFDESAPEYEW